MKSHKDLVFCMLLPLIITVVVPSHLGLAYVLLVETNSFPELVVIFPDNAIRTSLDTFSILLYVLTVCVVLAYALFPLQNILLLVSQCVQHIYRTLIHFAYIHILMLPSKT